jgi:hypothetical protein
LQYFAHFQQPLNLRTTYSFDITNRRKRYYTISANILLLICFAWYDSGLCNNLLRCLILPLTFLGLVLARFIFILTKPKIQFTSLHFALVAALCWLMEKEYGISVLILTLGLFEYLVNRDTTCTIDKNGIYFNNLPPRRYAWKDVENLILKDGILTIDQKNNRIFQLDLSEEKLNFKEEELNEYCRQFIGQ